MRRITDIVVEHLDIDVKKVTLSAKFVEDLGADSLDTVELVLECEEEFGVKIPDDDAEGFRTIDDVVKFLCT